MKTDTEFTIRLATEEDIPALHALIEASVRGLQAGDYTQAQIDGALAAPPSADSNPRNPPNGMIFAGRGKYQLYRQGDITWRLNTDTGQACILFATDAEWGQPRVFQQGCGAK